jgi:predicted ATPase
MHIAKIEIENVRSLEQLSWSVPEGRSAGWHVILGDNGAGKSSFLKSICLALVGADEAAALRQPWGDWLARGQDCGSIALELGWDSKFDNFSGKGNTPTTGSFLPVEVEFVRIEDTSSLHVELKNIETSPSPTRHIWNGGKGWFAASYGPFRRFTGGDPHTEKMFYSMPRLARHLSLFDERVALTECLDWLKSLKFKELENNKEGVTDPEGSLLKKVKTFLNGSGFLPASVTLVAVNSNEVTFNDANGINVPVEELSDGYRSVLSMTFELIRQLSSQFGAENVFSEVDPTIVIPSGVVFIDEIDAHLHPTWQRKIGKWFCDHFPNVQFIVSTHSPLVCQSAERGSIYMLPDAGTENEPRMLEGTELNRLVFGNVLEAYGTDAFGGEAALTRSDESKKKHGRLAELNNKEIIKKLSDSEKSEQQELRLILPTIGSTMAREKE